MSNQIELFYALKLMPNSLPLFKRWVVETEKDLEKLQAELKINSEKLQKEEEMMMKKEMKVKMKKNEHILKLNGVKPRRSFRLYKKKVLKIILKTKNQRHSQRLCEKRINKLNQESGFVFEK